MGWDVVAYNPNSELNPYESEIVYFPESEIEDAFDPWYKGIYSNFYRVKKSWREYGNDDPFWFVPSDTDDAKEITDTIKNGILSNDKWIVKYADWLSYWIEKGAYFMLSH